MKSMYRASRWAEVSFSESLENVDANMPTLGSTEIENLAVVECMGVFGDACCMDGVVNDLVHRLYHGIRMENGSGQQS